MSRSTNTAPGSRRSTISWADPLSLDCTLNLTVLDPLAEPMIHKAFPGGIEDLREYVMEVQGVKDHWVKNMNDPKDTRWEYTYHGRLARYGTWQESGKRVGPFDVDQVEHVIAKLVKQPFTRQAQMITWMPNIDLDCYDPPCLQSLWYRLLEDDAGTSWLNCNIRFRSNDAWGASFMNRYRRRSCRVRPDALPQPHHDNCPARAAYSRNRRR